jgi:hypothetical protein
MNKNNLSRFVLLGLSVATVSLSLMPSAALAWGGRYTSPYPVSGDSCVKKRGNSYWTCYRTPGGDYGVRIQVGNRRIRF